MNITKKIKMSVMLALSALSLTTSLPATAQASCDAIGCLGAAQYCTGCHDGLTVNGVVIGAGAEVCPQRSASEWTTTINRMNSKGCGVPADSIAGIANYLAGLGSTVTTTTTTTLGCVGYWVGTVWICSSSAPSTTTTSSTTTTTMGGTLLTCYGPGLTSGLVLTTTAGSCPVGYSTTLPNCERSFHNMGSIWVCEGTTTTSPYTTTTSTTTTTTTTSLYTCYNADGSSFIASGYCPIGTGYFPPPPCPDGVITPTSNHQWVCTPTTTSTTTTVSSTTTTTLCNTYVNGTTQYKYSGSGSCHSFANDDMTGLHIVRDQSYCKKHMTHLNSKGNHVHAYPHPACM